jgi:hypothetical protein
VTDRPRTVAVTGSLVARALRESADPFAIRDFVDDYRRPGRAGRPGLLAEEPAPTGDPRFDAYLAAMAEHFAQGDGFPAPGWAEGPGRFLERSWFHEPREGFWPLALVQAPPAFRRRLVFIEEPEFDRVWGGRAGPAVGSSHARTRSSGRCAPAKGLHERGVHVGGAATRLAHDARAATRDVDGVFEPKAVVAQEARRIARAMDLVPDWLHDGVQEFRSPIPAREREVLDALPGLLVWVPEPASIFARKCLASRVEDRADILTLAGRLGLRRAADAVDAALRVDPSSRLLPKTRFMIEELLDRGPQAAHPPGFGAASAPPRGTPWPGAPCAGQRKGKTRGAAHRPAPRSSAAAGRP